MKKIIPILILCLGCIAAKAQTPKILISYDENGNRILRQYVANRPASSQNNNDSTLVAVENKDATTTGVAAITGDNLKVYPNPSNDNFNVMVSEGILKNKAELILIDQLGREHKRLQVKSVTTTISTKGMADGVYSIVVQYGNTKSTIKIAKVKD